MNPILETKAPFVIKVYDNYFNVSWDGLSDKSEDNYFYKKIKSVTIKKGKYNKTRSTIDLLLDLTLNLGTFETYDTDELLIEFKTGEVETRYLQGESSDKILEAVDLIKSKISKNE